MTRTMGEPFYGTGKPPEGWKDGDYLEASSLSGWSQIKIPRWLDYNLYRLEANHPFYGANTMTDAELIEEIKIRNPGWEPPALPDRAEALAKGWYKEWLSEGAKGHAQGVALFIARKLIDKGVL